MRGQTTRTIILGGMALLAASSPAAAQKAFLSINGGGQLGSPNFKHEATYPFRSPVGTWNVRVGAEYPVVDAGMIDVGGGLFVKPNIAVGTMFTRASQTTGASLSLEAVDPTDAAGPMRFSGTTSIDRSEVGIHFFAIYFYPINDHLTVSFFGGPSYLGVTQHVVEQLHLTETLALSAANGTREIREFAWGVNGGAEVSYFFSDLLGVALSGRFTRATMEFENRMRTTLPDERVAVRSDAGGAQVSAGLRLRFRARWWM